MFHRIKQPKNIKIIKTSLQKELIFASMAAPVITNWLKITNVLYYQIYIF